MIQDAAVPSEESLRRTHRRSRKNGRAEAIQPHVATNPVVGAWKLVSIEDTRSNGEVIYWMGSKPTGMIIYDPMGHMSVQFMRDPRPTFASEYNRATADEVKKAYEGYFAYFGTYEVDEKKGVVTHHLQGSLRPQEVGIDYDREFKLENGRLELTMKVPGKDEGRRRRLLWERMK